MEKFEELRQKILTWKNEKFSDATAKAEFKHLEEEIEELDDAMFFPDNAVGIGEEIADCMFLLFGIANMNQIDILGALERKLEINMARNWGPPNADGVVHRLPEED